MNKVVIKILQLQGSVATQNVLGGPTIYPQVTNFLQCIQGRPKNKPGNFCNSHVRWANYISSSCKFLIMYLCQKLWKLAGCRQSYCQNYQAYFFGPPCICQKLWKLVESRLSYCKRKSLKRVEFFWPTWYVPKCFVINKCIMLKR